MNDKDIVQWGEKLTKTSGEFILEVSLITTRCVKNVIFNQKAFHRNCSRYYNVLQCTTMYFFILILSVKKMSLQYLS